MILRQWSGRASADRAEEYPRHFHGSVVPELRHIVGFLGATLARREQGETVEFTVISRWTSMEAVRAFAGDQPEKAVVEPGAVAALVNYDDTVRHSERVEEVLIDEDRPTSLTLNDRRCRLDIRASDISGSSFDNVSLSGARIRNVNFSGATFDDVNMSGWRVDAVNLAGLSVSNANLAGASIAKSRCDTMTIDGVSVADLFAAYHARNPG